MFRKPITHQLSICKYVALNKFYRFKFGWRYAGVFIVNYRNSETLDVMHGNVFGVGSGNASVTVIVLNPECFRCGSVTMLKSSGRLYLLTGNL